ncbi:phytanoyl-CoA dioxygenase family protein [Flavobacterium sp.]|uniref:phytanoyl-CoA dioxygenase family protein n=1 Tax=Flavobacterium sp. TaxID=239 RepID=UPI002B4AC6A7|nr:phytanoyl-CoA dioxygenase family protein [Flavobacterium sp.]HLP63971.1 phytanoyl-CoA dioxygenase family protein [Flavobacterium sp.]
MKTHLIANFWKRTLNSTNETSTWAEEVAFLYQSGISLEVAIAYLYDSQPSLDQFTLWIQQQTKSNLTSNQNTEDILTAEDLAFWNQNGYIVVKNVISKEDCENTRNAIWEFLGKSIEDEQSWYTQHPEQSGMMVHFSDHPTLNANRNSSRIKKAYEQLYQSTAIYKTIDKVSFNPPITNNYSFKGSNLHWDVSLHLPIPNRLQGLIYLSDCAENEGAFHCVPRFHNEIEQWMKNLPENVSPREYALQTLKPIPIVGEAGDMVIWHQALPHCATANYGKTPRMVQYLTYFPNEYKESEIWI